MESPSRKRKRLDLESEFKLTCEVDKMIRKIDIAADLGINQYLLGTI